MAHFRSQEGHVFTTRAEAVTFFKEVMLDNFGKLPLDIREKLDRRLQLEGKTLDDFAVLIAEGMVDEFKNDDPIDPATLTPVQDTPGNA